jgi:hypothetical protein
MSSAPEVKKDTFGEALGVVVAGEVKKETDDIRKVVKKIGSRLG